ncbi:NAD(P)-binding protein [Starkeya sp. ORNL1]|uniref:FAD-dependent monooxygenase n=1 Tax=Starkeya sp. ORNL1 TaxID=2709380 RepID=UPI0014639B3D|nr:FAD-dependent monooxygenase [Starkeya sp. ORNL1]QJP13645.1 NAD(P)-binding protein [Starkeya sp. ORNL1]
MASDILVIGAGPVGLTLACELARHGVRPRIIDQLDAPSPYCRAIGVTPRTLEVMEDMGVVRELVDAGLWLTGMRLILPGAPVKELTLDLSDLPFAALGVPQYATEAVLTAHLASYGITVERGIALAGLSQDADGVDVELDTSGGRMNARFRHVVGCDGAHSAVRKALGIGFEGDAFPSEFMLGDVHIDWDLARGMTLRAIVPVEDAAPDFLVAVPLPERGRYRVSMPAPERLAAPSGSGTDHGIQADRPGATLDDLQAVADRLLPTHATFSDLRWSSIFRISMRLADKYRVGKVFIAGDACHIHPPTGGQGMNTGIQDAYNLAWKLALVTRGHAAEALLDSYEAERRPVAADVVARTTEATVNLGHEGRKAPPDRLADTQVLVSYAGGPLSAGPGSANLRPGDRVPDVPGLRRSGFGFPLRLFELLRGTRHVLLAPLVDGDTWKVEAGANTLRTMFPDLVRVIAIAPGDAVVEEPPGVELIHDAAGAFRTVFGEPGGLWLVRPDGYLGLHRADWSECAVVGYLRDVVGLKTG